MQDAPQANLDIIEENPLAIIPFQQQPPLDEIVNLNIFIVMLPDHLRIGNINCMNELSMEKFHCLQLSRVGSLPHKFEYSSIMGNFRLPPSPLLPQVSYDKDQIDHDVSTEGQLKSIVQVKVQ